MVVRYNLLHTVSPFCSSSLGFYLVCLMFFFSMDKDDALLLLHLCGLIVQFSDSLFKSLGCSSYLAGDSQWKKLRIR